MLPVLCGRGMVCADFSGPQVVMNDENNIRCSAGSLDVASCQRAQAHLPKK